MIEFDAETTRILETAYEGADFARRRRASFDAVDPRPGEHILDLGCGPGFLTREFARAIGPGGRVTGVDPSPEMRTAAAERCAGLSGVEILEGSAAALPLEDASTDKAVSVQVFEYINDFDAPLAELHRVLRPGGRLVIADMHWDTLVWHSTDRDRMARMIAAWDAHLADRIVPEKLPAPLARAGFGGIRTIPHPMLDTVLKPDGLARVLMILMVAFARGNDLMPEADIAAWAAEQEALAAEGRFFMSLTHFVTVAEKR
ncbi:methyltransferase domain-containing protein [Defluviimonas sp. WL0024]|uniref:Methyltransferase domain-containing protein n=2 Tax=Albidovulum TaxID=205889 RepID=A0ABT3J354_9RHOB|nr:MULTISPECIES: methyltransferase domain-containing protein [Defluviimonas]MCU9847672.1 methyltransferase domain-containing protein [Defluviimonas sp. WL0024]MCW3781900.1 methyltransferase domain-containing protein [Defluviimonas salinarum]